MNRFAMLLAVADICLPLAAGGSAEPALSSAAADNLLTPAALALPLPNDNFHFDDFFEIDGVEELGDVRERGTEVLRRDSGGSAMPGEMGYGRGRTSGADGAD